MISRRDLLRAGAGLALVGSTLFLPRTGPSLAVPVALYVAGMGLVMPQAFAASLQPFPERAGAASSLGGVIQQSAAAIVGAAVGHAIGTTAWPLTPRLTVYRTNRGHRSRFIDP